MFYTNSEKAVLKGSAKLEERSWINSANSGRAMKKEIHIQNNVFETPYATLSISWFGMAELCCDTHFATNHEALIKLLHAGIVPHG